MLAAPTLTGQIVGFYEDSALMGHGFLDTNGVFTTVDNPNGVSSFAFGINGTGQVVGEYSDSSGVGHGFLFENGVFTTINDPNGTQGTVANGISSADQIVGSYIDNTFKHGYVATVTSTPEPSSLSMI